MKIKKYQTTNENDGLKYFFDSIGERTIKKVVQYQQLLPLNVMDLGLSSQVEVYNLAFGDFIGGIDDFSDQITSNNGDMDNVLATVADTAFNFWKLHPDAFILFEGSHPESEEGLRTYLYQKKIERFFDEINEVAHVVGRFGNKLEIFERGKKYNAFLIIQKR
jgi:hypothetical protein